MQPARTGPESASLIVLDPNGGQNRTPIAPLPFTMGRSLENNLVLRDSRVSRSHARIVVEGGQYHVEDCGSTHGTFVNGQRIEKTALKPGDRIEFGAPDSYAAIFAIEGADFRRLMEQFESSGASAKAAGAGGSLAKLRAIIDLARTIQSSFSIDDVLVSVVDAALAITGAERGFLMLRSGDGLSTRVARGHDGQRLDDSDLRVPRELLRRSLERRRDLLSMNFDPASESGASAGSTIADLELRSVVCVPLVRIRAG
jgi:pSer/pThr/pTyr-binding forkhead associated (FHA) protein